MSEPATFIMAGRRAAEWVLDTGECLFCAVDCAPKGSHHERHCTFYGLNDDQLHALLDRRDVPPVTP